MADYYYESTGPILWAEHKHIEKPWAEDRVVSAICSSASWPSQQRWLVRAHGNGKQAIVIVGVGKGRHTKSYILPFPYSFSVKEHLLLDLDQVTQYIVDKTTNDNSTRETEG